jgi:LacI family transcriptional regulator
VNLLKTLPTSSGAVTLKTIADSLGVSVTTVARALKDGHKIGEATVRKVKEEADRLGYVRNLDGLKLRTGKTLVVMAFLGHTTEEEIGDSGSVGLLNGIHSRFVGTGYAVRTVPVTIGESGLEQIEEVVRGRNADGIILDHTRPQDQRVRYLLERDFPFVTFGRTELFSDHAYFDLDNELAAYQGTKSLIDAGYKKIAMLDADEDFLFVKQRMRGYTSALREAGRDVDASMICHIPLEADVAREKTRALVDGGADAIVCVNELVFLGARAACRDALRRDPRSIGFSVRVGTNIGEYLGTPMTASYFSRFEAGWNLADLLLKRIGGADMADCQIVAKPVLRLYES